MKKILTILFIVFSISACSDSPEKKYMIALCEDTMKSYINCRCFAKKYLDSLSEEEKTELRSSGLIFPGYGWKIDSYYMENLTFSIMEKTRNAIDACSK